ncbi:phospholipase C [Solimonas aquatica]|uniref:Phospholipase C n=1 Tax=Solimonas aquatica TaxID=489703 RepID=A0A1H9L561_9GAMM|nr:alkaline phosphatase family protein [Solimonas aquatica]SER06295.1 phospholipase C [Solimonas aquatica]
MNQSDEAGVDRRRRQLLAGLAATAGLSACGSSEAPGTVSIKSLPLPADSGIDHIVVVMMENRSFDHYLGWVPGANGRQANLGYQDSEGQTQRSHHLQDYQNCALADPDHSYEAGRRHFNNGQCDGFLLTQPAGDLFPIGYYTADDLPFYKGLVEHWTVCDRYHTGLMGPTYPNRLYMHAGQTDRLENTEALFKQPTVWDALKSVNAEGRYYHSDAAGYAFVSVLLAGHNPGAANILPLSRFMSDAASGNLPDVAFVDPAMLNEEKGTSNDDHPLADIRAGQVFLNSIYEALRTSPQWSKTLLIINYDEWGGFFDHVPPPIAPVGYEEFKATGNDGRLGFRVPCFAIGPRARRGYIESRQLDPNSILNLIAWRFGFAPLGARGASSMNFAQVLDLESAPRLDAPVFDVPDDPSYGTACAAQLSQAAKRLDAARLAEVERRHREHRAEWQSLVQLALDAGHGPVAT